MIWSWVAPNQKVENPNNHIASELDSTEIVKIRKKTQKFAKIEVDFELESTKPKIKSN